jgi:acyl-CoA synthetase (AMP-forming)/AMP-acid ligase II
MAYAKSCRSTRIQLDGELVNIANLLHAAALRHRLHPAVTDAKGSHNYGELANRTLRLAEGLRQELKLRPKQRVVLCMENCSEFFEILFACWSAGLCVAPVNSRLHAREVNHIMNDSGSTVCFVTPDQYGSLTEEIKGDPTKKVINVDSEEYRALFRAGDQAVSEVLPDDPAWMFYTSGTTGRPKGALISHRALLFMSHCFYADIDFVAPGDTQLHAAPLSHAGGLYSLPHLAKGGHQVVLHSHFEASEVFTAIQAHHNVTLFAAPTMLTRLLNAPNAESEDVSNIRTVIYGGGPMYISDLKRALALFGPKLFQVYGQGEVPMTITGLDKKQHGAVGEPNYDDILTSVGSPRTGVEVKIVNHDGMALPTGETGEVVTRSGALMSGYWGDLENPVRDGWLYTGDLGSLDDSGLLTLRGRSKELIVSGGSNVYPREVEDVLLQHPYVAECAVIGRPHAEWGEEVVAFIVPVLGEEIATGTLDAMCLERIARFKRPKEYFMLESMPKNHYGKVVKTELAMLLAVDNSP